MFMEWSTVVSRYFDKVWRSHLGAELKADMKALLQCSVFVFLAISTALTLEDNVVLQRLNELESQLVDVRNRGI